MFEENQESAMDAARFWETIYNESTLETEWRQAQDNMQRMMNASEHYSQMNEHISSLNKENFLQFYYHILL